MKRTDVARDNQRKLEVDQIRRGISLGKNNNFLLPSNSGEPVPIIRAAGGCAIEMVIIVIGAEGWETASA